MCEKDFPNAPGRTYGNIVSGKFLRAMLTREKKDYWIYIVVPGKPVAKIKPYRGGSAPHAELHGLDQFADSCGIGEIGQFVLVGRGPTSQAMQVKTIAKAIAELVGNDPPELMWLRFDSHHNLIISFQQEIEVDAKNVQLHPDWSPD